jgi:hypothetical protein
VNDAFFHRLLESGGERSAIAVLEAYLDESERTGGVFCIAGYLFVPRQARRFAKEWTDLFGPSGTHMVDLCARQRQFKNVRRPECDRLLKEAIKIIKCRMTLGVVVSCDVHDVDRLSPKFVVGFGHAYPVCCHLVMGTAGGWVKQNRPGEKITFVFESGHEFEREANRFLSSAIDTPDVKDFYQYSGHAFLPKCDAVPLQAADLLAWEWTKFKDETHDRKIRPLRKSLYALIDGSLDRYKTAHLNKEPLKRYFNHVRSITGFEIKAERKSD